MTYRFTEQATLFASVIKWTVYATIIGVLVGISTTIFLFALKWSTTEFSKIPNYYLLLPAVILICSGLVKWLAPNAAGHGTEKVIEAVHKNMGRIPILVVPVKLVATVITLAGGGSAGKEGPAAQIGAGIASSFADLMRINDTDRKKLVICGISAGFATIFGTPVAGAIFGVEVLVLGQLVYDVLFPSFVAGIIGYHVASKLGGIYLYFKTPNFPIFSSWNLFEIMMLGVWCGVIALLFIEIVKFGEHSFNSLKMHWSLKALLGGILLILIARFVSTDYLGLGLNTLTEGIQGNIISKGAIFWKSIATSITLGSGGSGGIITPIFFVGTASGNLFAQIFNPQYIAAFSAIGMIAVLAATTNTPIASSIMAIELFGANIAPYAALASMISYLICGYRSIYPSQLLGNLKSGALSTTTGIAIGEIDRVTLTPRKSPIIRLIIKIRKRFRKSKMH